MADHWRECRRIIAEHSKSFDLASRLFPAGRRDEVAALYAWCRLCDDAIDLAPAETHAEAIEGLRATVRSIYDGMEQPDAVLACFQEVVSTRRVPIEYPLELIAGQEMDVIGTRYETLDDLLVYCWRVAGTVGLMMAHLMGVSEERATTHAAHLGIAMQLTNIARDVAEDWERGRVYLPSALLDPGVDRWLASHIGDAERPPLPGTSRDALAGAVASLLERAEEYYASADVGLRYLEPRSALAVRTARAVYAEIGRVIEARGCDPLQGRAVVTRRRKLRLVAGTIGRYWGDRRHWSSAELVSPSGVLRCADAVRLA